MRPPNLPFERVLEVFRSFRPDYVGISAQSPDAPVMHRVARAIRRERPEVPVICGGVHATAYWQDIMPTDPAIDFILPGEGEVVFHDLIETLERKGDPGTVPGVVRRVDGAIVHTGVRKPVQDMDIFPHPAWDLVDPDTYAALPRIGLVYKARRYMIVETARGCPFQCAWCHKTMGRVHRMHSPSYVVEQVEKLTRDHGVREIQIVDDLFNFDNGRMIEIFSRIIERKIRVAICIPNGIRADRLPDQTLELMKKAGVYRVMFAVETASGRLQKLMRKEMDFSKLEQAIRKADELGIMVHGNFIIGLPTETQEEARETVRYAERSLIDTVGIYRAIPFKGSDLYRIASEQGVPVPKGESTLSFWDPEVNLSRTPTGVLNRLKKDAYRRIYLRPERIARLIRKLPNRLILLPFLFRFFVRKALRDN
jgi:radical SAM superfamily enzyme YgiQ (UPF0313 family)